MGQVVHLVLPCVNYQQVLLRKQVQLSALRFPPDRPLGVPDRLEIAGDALQADISIICHELDPHFLSVYQIRI